MTVNAAMVVGNTREAVTVEASPVAVQFNTASMSNTVDMRMADSLPEISRNPFMMVSLDPAVVVNSTTQQEPFHFWAASQFSIGGPTNTMNDIILDGSPNMAVAKSGYTPPQDAVQQTSIQQSAVDAEYGHSAGGVIGVITKSGTNEIHGSAYYMTESGLERHGGPHDPDRQSHPAKHLWRHARMSDQERQDLQFLRV